MPDPPSKATYALVSLGCPKNLIDSERMAGLLRRGGYRLVERVEDADFVVVNTCGFLVDAREESIEVIREMTGRKRQGHLRAVIVAGCLAERDREALFDACPGVDQVVGVFARDEIVAAINRALGGEEGPRAWIRPVPDRALDDGDRLRLTPGHVTYLRIAEGCDRKCSFCTIPSIRGPLRSKPIERVVAEAERLAADGVKELVLVAQDTSCYGGDLYGRPRLAELLGRLDAIGPLAWIRLMYVYPIHVSEELIDVLASAGRILPYIDLPLQHINDEVLRRMRRSITRTETERLLDRLRGRIGGLVLRTTVIVGFPGETDGQFDELLDFVRRQRFERLGVFTFRDEPGTPASELDGKVPEEVKRLRRDRLMAAQQEIAFAWNAEQVGRRLDVLVDRDILGEQDAHVGRSYADAPEIDGVVYVTGKDVVPGEIVPCEIVASRGYDLIGARDEGRAVRGER